MTEPRFSSFNLYFMFVKTLITLLLFFTGSSLFSKEPSSHEKKMGKLSADQQLSEVARRLHLGQKTEAFEILQKISRSSINSANRNRFDFLKGVLLLEQNQPEEALSLFNAVEPHYNTLKPLLLYYQARAYRMAQKPKEAVQKLETFLQESPTAFPAASREYLLALCDDEKYDQAQTQLQLAAEYSKLKWPLKLAWSSCLQKRGQSTAAFENLREIYIQAPMGISESALLEQLRQLHDANAKTASLFSINDHLQRVESLKAQDRWIEAAELLKKSSLQLDSKNNSSLKRMFADTFFKARFYPEAAEAFEKLLANATLTEQEKKEITEKLASSYVRSNQFE